MNNQITVSLPVDAELDLFCGRTEFLSLLARRATSSCSSMSGCTGLGRNLAPVLETLNETPIAGKFYSSVDPVPET